MGGGQIRPEKREIEKQRGGPSERSIDNEDKFGESKRKRERKHNGQCPTAVFVNYNFSCKSKEA